MGGGGDSCLTDFSSILISYIPFSTSCYSNCPQTMLNTLLLCSKSPSDSQFTRSKDQNSYQASQHDLPISIPELSLLYLITLACCDFLHLFWVTFLLSLPGHQHPSYITIDGIITSFRNLLKLPFLQGTFLFHSL